MALTLAFRTGFFVVSLILLSYGRTLVTSSVILALAAWLAYGHPSSNSVGQEILVFFITWVSAVGAAALLGASLNVTWLFELEWSVVSRNWSRIRVSDAVRWLLAALATAIAYTSTEVFGYDKGTFYRVPAWIFLLVLMLALYGYDLVASNHGYHVLPADKRWHHISLTVGISVALFIDILARDPGFWRWLVPVLGVWAALQVPKALALIPVERLPEKRE